ncbi:hypothetical protein MPTK1_3g16860 [Marchantia polymorpha subsp. ruderalis]|uniref:Uncharacterized protein n=2 Tax=Marchantia polymorpha TaxID=3197 RepID=A0AAF6B1L9_MARPO|nr:hypothetical protein MARPO_0039s0109 [Marchantia polymorpha]BBN05903.1 hypothetical protein Mp_3g16860 [Marchantia polymorpha subsp. ruderalis]|eukprot:PTQ40622.1 hypothetical protein MARPO_0039s0109 [Marchantia polymorpha]
MWGGDSFMRGPGGHLGSKSAPCSPVKPFQKRVPAQPDSFHVIHKVPLGDSPYVKAKHVQLVDKDPDTAIALFWAAINAGDRVDSALKDMAIVMKQQNRPEEAIEAIKSLRYRCSDAAQESLDNVLLDLYKRCGRLDDQIALLKHKLHLIHQGMAFNGKRTKTARSQGKKFQVSIEQEATRLLGNLGWAYMQQSNFLAAEAVYRKALSIGPDNNKVCNLGICLMKQGRLEEAKSMLQSVVPACPDTRWGSDSHLKSYERAQEMLLELEASMGRSSGLPSAMIPSQVNSLLQSSLWQPQAAGSHAQTQTQSQSQNQRSMEEKSDYSLQDLFSGALSATAGFGPAPPANSRPMQKKMAPSIQHNNQNAQQQQQRQQEQQRPRTAHDLGSSQFQGFQTSSYQPVWDDYESEYDSEFESENVDTNIQGVSQVLAAESSHFQQLQQMQQWPGEALHRQRSENLSGARSESNFGHQQPQQQQQMPLGVKRVDRNLNFGGSLRENTASYNNNNNNNNSNSNSHPFAQQQQRDGGMSDKHQIFSTTSQNQKPVVNERAPLAYDRTNVYKSVEEENKLTTDGWGKPSKSPLGNSELSFFSRWGYNENRASVRRSLSLESFDTQLELIALENEEADASNDITFQQQQHQVGAQVKRPRNGNGTPIKEKSSSLWGSLGFFHTSQGLEFAQNEAQLHDMNKQQQQQRMINSAVANTSSIHHHHQLEQQQQQLQPAVHHVHLENRPVSEKQFLQPQQQPMSTQAAAADAEAIKRQRRLRVFQEITLFPGSPQHVGV